MSDEITQYRSPVNIERMNVSPLPQLILSLGDESSFINIISKTPGISGIVWNEEKITLMIPDRTMTIQFYPEINEITKMFLTKEEPRRRRDNIFGIPQGPKVWEGEFEPIVFSKSKLIEFLKTYNGGLQKEVLESIRNMKVTQRKSEEEEMISLDESETRTIIEESFTTNIPKRFNLLLPVSGSYIGDFEFEASVVAIENDYGTKTNKKGIQLRCLNGRNVLRDMMLGIMCQMPQDIPKYYGAMGIEISDRSRII